MLRLDKVKRWAKKPEGVFALVSCLFGLLFLVAIPPLQTPDEETHFLRAFQVSEGQIIAERNGNERGGYLPKSINKTFYELEKGNPIRFHTEMKFNNRNIIDAMKVDLDMGDKQFYSVTSAAAYSPVGYLPQAMAIQLGKIANAPPVIHIYLARLATLATWIVLIYFAIRLMPYKKWAIVAVALLPMMVAQSVSIGVDALSIGTSALFLSLVLHSMSLRFIDKKIAAFIMLTAVVMVLSKQIALILLPLVLFIKGEQIKWFKHPRLLKAGFIVLPILALAVWTLLVGDPGHTSTQIANGQSTSGQVRYLIEHPLHVPKILFNTFFFNWGDNIIDSVIGVFGWMDTPLSGAFVIFGYMILTIVFMLNYREKAKYESNKRRWALLITAILYFLSVCGALYVTYSPVGFNIIYGVQGRYLLPILFILVPVFANKFALVSKRQYILSTLVPLVFLLVASLATIIMRFYITYKY